MADTTSSTANLDPSTTPSADAPVALSDEQRSNPRYLEMFKAVIGACLAKIGDASDAVDAALEAADACYVKLFGAVAQGQGKSVVPEGMLHEPHHPNLDPACPQRLHDHNQKPGEPAPVTPAAPAEPETPATPPADQVPATEDPANPAPVDSAPSASEPAQPETGTASAESSAQAPDAEVATHGESQAPKL